MPYLADQDKKDLEFKDNYESIGRIEKLTDYLDNEPIDRLAGAINYLNFIIVRRWIDKNGKKYFVFAAILGTLVCCIFEIYRRLVAPYEEEKIKSNGDAE
jgi:hypothetical protein